LHLRKAQHALKLPALTWYQSTRHTFASHWVMNGGSIMRLKDLLGHSSVSTTERYAKLAPDHYSPADLDRLAGNLSVPAAGAKASKAARADSSRLNLGRRGLPEEGAKRSEGPSGAGRRRRNG
jgi:hypothetical protein